MTRVRLESAFKRFGYTIQSLSGNAMFPKNAVVNVYIVLFHSLLIIQAQNHVNDLCKMANGKQGKCIRFENCPSAIELIRRREGTPQHCGFEGHHPIVCCETKAPLRKLPVGEVTKQKCVEYYKNFPIIIIQSSPVATTTEKELPEDISFADLIKLAEKEEEEAKRAGKPLPPVRTEAVGGINAGAKEFPHMAALGFGELSDITWGCGGSLISEKFVLTAAHCINTAIGKVNYIRLGDLKLNETEDNAKPQDFKVARVIIHPLYKAPSVYNDIAIVELSRKADFDDYVRPACLQTDRNITEPIWSATGWGVTSYLGTQANHLQNVRLREFVFEECQSAYASTSKRRLENGIDFHSQVCAGEEYKDTCQGDSGGPLQIRNRDYSIGFKVIGITSFGKACGIGNGPSVYTRVSHYIEWIESVVWPQ